MHLRGTLLCTKISIYKKQDQQKHQTQGQYLLSLSRTESSAKEISSKRKKLPSFMARTRGPSCHSKSRDVSISSYNLEKEVKLKGVCLQDNTHMASWCLLQWSGHSATSHAKVWEPGTQATQTGCSWGSCRPVKICRYISNLESKTLPGTKAHSWLGHSANWIL